RAARLICAPSVGPGYEATRATGDARIRPRLDGRTYDAMWQAAILALPDRVTITSYNEWHEGTQIEAAREQPVRARVLSSSPVEHFAYDNYDGAYGLHGKTAPDAYLERTAVWAKAFGRSLRRQ